MNVKLDHINFYVKSIRDSVDWYQKVFKFELVEKGVSERGREYAVLKSGDSMLCMLQPKESLDQPQGYSRYQLNHFALRVSDKHQWENIMDKYNIPEKFGGATQYPFSTSWYINDPTGHEIEVVHWNNEAPEFP